MCAKAQNPRIQHTQNKPGQMTTENRSQNNFFKIKPPGMTTNEIVLFFPPLSGYYIHLHTGRRGVVEK